MNRYFLAAAAAAFIAAAGACSDSTDISASAPNVVDTVTLWALTGGPLTQPTAYSVSARAGLRTWEAGNSFDFVFDEDANGNPVFIPTDVLGLLSSTAFKPGLKRSEVDSFSQMVKAPQNNYIVSDTIPIAVGDFFYIRTTISTCSSLSVPEYGKLEVLALDSVAHTMTMQVLANQNCGFRGLRVGLPKT